MSHRSMHVVPLFHWGLSHIIHGYLNTMSGSPSAYVVYGSHSVDFFVSCGVFSFPFVCFIMLS